MPSVDNTKLLLEKSPYFKLFQTFELAGLRTPHGSIAPNGGQIIGQSTEKSARSFSETYPQPFDLKIAIFSTALVLENMSMCLFLLYNTGAQIFQSPQDFALRE